jgi:hypothetical protein
LSKDIVEKLRLKDEAEIATVVVVLVLDFVGFALEEELLLHAEATKLAANTREIPPRNCFLFMNTGSFTYASLVIFSLRHLAARSHCLLINNCMPQAVNNLLIL